MGAYLSPIHLFRFLFFFNFQLNFPPEKCYLSERRPVATGFDRKYKSKKQTNKQNQTKMVRSYFILGLSLAQAALVFENHDLNHLDIDFSKSSLSVLDRVAREFDDESSGDEELPL